MSIMNCKIYRNKFQFVSIEISLLLGTFKNQHFFKLTHLGTTDFVIIWL